MREEEGGEEGRVLRSEVGGCVVVVVVVVVVVYPHFSAVTR